MSKIPVEEMKFRELMEKFESHMKYMWHLLFYSKIVIRAMEKRAKGEEVDVQAIVDADPDKDNKEV